MRTVDLAFQFEERFSWIMLSVHAYNNNKCLKDDRISRSVQIIMSTELTMLLFQIDICYRDISTAYQAIQTWCTLCDHEIKSTKIVWHDWLSFCWDESKYWSIWHSDCNGVPFLFCRPTLDSSAWLSTPTVACPSTPTESLRSSRVKGDLRCLLICSLWLTTLTETCCKVLPSHMETDLNFCNSQPYSEILTQWFILRHKHYLCG